eukprot:scaffold1579_cov215-Prasinococcus_capsulatus_cf.AAC.3
MPSGKFEIVHPPSPSPGSPNRSALHCCDDGAPWDGGCGCGTGGVPAGTGVGLGAGTGSLSGVGAGADS